VLVFVVDHRGACDPHPVMPEPIVADATATEHRPPAHPEDVEAWEALGFRVLGRFATLQSASRQDLVYGRAERQRLSDWRLRPAATVLAAPDGSAYVTVDVFGDAPLSRMRTELDDGSIVETIGMQEAGALRPRGGGNPLAGFTSAATADHPIRLIADPTPAAIAAAHGDHVATVSALRGARSLRHDQRDHALRVATRAVAHHTAVQRRLATMTRVVGITLILLLGAFFMGVEIGYDTPLPVALLLDLQMVLLWLLLLAVTARPLAKARWWRPSLLGVRR
jgi:hypothetical protein